MVIEDEKVIATILCGQDFRRGFLYHLYISEEYRKQGLGKALVLKCLDNQKKKGFPNATLCILIIMKRQKYSGKNAVS